MMISMTSTESGCMEDKISMWMNMNFYYRGLSQVSLIVKFKFFLHNSINFVHYNSDFDAVNIFRNMNFSSNLWRMKTRDCSTEDMENRKIIDLKQHVKTFQ